VALSSVVKRPEREKTNTHSHLVTSLGMCGAIPPLSHKFSWCGACLSRGTTLPVPLPSLCGRHVKIATGCKFFDINLRMNYLYD
jgi:hypothetical protein